MEKRKKRGIVGIEAAIVLIAFVIVAAALAFVALNMGLFTTQKSKEVISKGLGEASTALEIDGAITGLSNGTYIMNISVPLKTSAGVQAVDLSPSRVTVRIIANGVSFENIYTKIYYYNNTDGKLYNPLNTAETVAVSDMSTQSLFNAIWTSSVTTPQAVIVILKNVTPDSVLEFSEKAVLLINLGSNNALPAYAKLNIEIRPPEGAPLTAERIMPPNLPVGAVNLE